MKILKVDAPFDGIDSWMVGKNVWIFDNTKILDLPDINPKDLWQLEMCYFVINEKLEYSLVNRDRLEVFQKGSLRSSLEGMPLPSSRFDTTCILNLAVDFASKIAVVITTEELHVQLLNTNIRTRLRPGDGLSSATDDTRISIMEGCVKQSVDWYVFLALHYNCIDFIRCDLNPTLPKSMVKPIMFSCKVVGAALFKVGCQ